MLKLLLIGPPGAGKGTQAKKISERYQIPHISTGDILREIIMNKAEPDHEVKAYIETGQLVPDDLILEIVFGRLQRDDCRHGYILDGFPRNLSQAVAFHNLLAEKQKQPPVAIFIDVEKKVILDRLTGRKSCEKCGAVYNIKQAPPQKDGICDKCGGKLYQRKDDREEVIRERLKVYFKQIIPLVAYYKKSHCCCKIEGSGDADWVFSNICEALDNEKYRRGLL